MSSVNVNGRNFFTNIDIENENIISKYEDQSVFSLPIRTFNNLYSNNNELTIELNKENELEGNDIELTEMRFLFPINTDNKEVDNEDKIVEEEEREEGSNEESEPKQKESLAYLFEKKIKDSTSIKFEDSEKIITLNDLQFLVPRGKYNCDMHHNMIKLHGQTFNFFIYYKNIVRVFLLPLQDKTNMSFIIQLDKPLILGSTSYQYLIIKFKNNHDVELNLNIGAEKLKDLNLNLQPSYSGLYYEIVSNLFKSIIGINIIIPGEFKSSKGENYIKTNVTTNNGSLFFLNKSIIFIVKPIIYIRLTDIVKVQFLRIGLKMAHREFDFEIFTKSGISHVFGNIEKEELDLILNYFKNNNVIVNTEEELEDNNEEFSKDEDEDEEEDEDSEENDDDFIAKSKQESEDDESDDEDFDPEKHIKKKVN